MKNKKEKIIVALSGGIDSSYVIYLLKQNPEYEIEAVFMRNWDRYLNNDLNELKNNLKQEDFCDSIKEYEVAQKVAKFFKVKLHFVNFVDQYFQKVFLNFLNNLKQGLTPNPDVLCNQKIKFGIFLEYVLKKYNASYIASGHYAKKIFNPKINEFQLLIPKDKNKDQTYFLSLLNQDMLKKSLFPLENILKTQIRKNAKALNFPNSTKKDSSGICFIGKRNYQSFLGNYLPIKKGDTIDILQKKIIGIHNGVYFYTINQRKNLNLSGFDAPYYVVGKNIQKNILYVANQNLKYYLNANRVFINQVHFINQSNYQFKELDCLFMFKYRQKKIKGKLLKINNLEYKIILEKSTNHITNGQYAVFYQNDVCLGCGVITKSYFNERMLQQY